MYQVSQADIERHKTQLLRNKQYEVVRQESFKELEQRSDAESQHKSVASRIFKNHEIAAARASHASAVAGVKIKEHSK